MKYPDTMLWDLSWSFGISSFNRTRTFMDDLVDFNPSANTKYWDQNLTTLVDSNTIKIRYLFYGEIIEDRELIIESGTKKSLELGEFLFKLNNLLFEELKDIDYRFFEGLKLIIDSEEEAFSGPIYFLYLGS